MDDDPTTAAFLGHRFWSFSHRTHTQLHRDYVRFVLVNVGTLERRRDETLIDGYSPFERDFKLTSLRIGIAWRRGS